MSKILLELLRDAGLDDVRRLAEARDAKGRDLPQDGITGEAVFGKLVEIFLDTKSAVEEEIAQETGAAPESAEPEAVRIMNMYKRAMGILRKRISGAGSLLLSRVIKKQDVVSLLDFFDNQVSWGTADEIGGRFEPFDETRECKARIAVLNPDDPRSNEVSTVSCLHELSTVYLKPQVLSDEMAASMMCYGMTLLITNPDVLHLYGEWEVASGYDEQSVWAYLMEILAADAMVDGQLMTVLTGYVSMLILKRYSAGDIADACFFKRYVKKKKVDFVRSLVNDAREKIFLTKMPNDTERMLRENIIIHSLMLMFSMGETNDHATLVKEFGKYILPVNAQYKKERSDSK